MISIVPFSRDKIEEVKLLTDEVFGKDYLTIDNLRDGFGNSWRLVKIVAFSCMMMLG